MTSDPSNIDQGDIIKPLQESNIDSKIETKDQLSNHLQNTMDLLSEGEEIVNNENKIMEKSSNDIKKAEILNTDNEEQINISKDGLNFPPNQPEQKVDVVVDLTTEKGEHVDNPPKIGVPNNIEEESKSIVETKESDHITDKQELEPNISKNLIANSQIGEIEMTTNKDHEALESHNENHAHPSVETNEEVPNQPPKPIESFSVSDTNISESIVIEQETIPSEIKHVEAKEILETNIVGNSQQNIDNEKNGLHQSLVSTQELSVNDCDNKVKSNLIIEKNTGSISNDNDQIHSKPDNTSVYVHDESEKLVPNSNNTELGQIPNNQDSNEKDEKPIESEMSHNHQTEESNRSEFSEIKIDDNEFDTDSINKMQVIKDPTKDQGLHKAEHSHHTKVVKQNKPCLEVSQPFTESVADEIVEEEDHNEENDIMITGLKSPRAKIPRIPEPRESRFSEDELKNALQKLIQKGVMPPLDMQSDLMDFARKQSVVHMINENYDSAQQIDNAMKLLSSSLNSDHIKYESDQITKVIAERLDQASKQQKSIEETFKSMIIKHKEQEQEKLEQMKKNHEAEIHRFEEQWTKPETLLPYSKPSSKLLQMRKMQKSLAIAHDFEGAKRMKIACEELQNNESVKAERKVEIAMKSQYQALLDKQEKEIKCLIKNGERKLALLESQREIELRSNENLRKQLSLKTGSQKQTNKKASVTVPLVTSRGSSEARSSTTGLLSHRTRNQFAVFKRSPENSKLDVKPIEVKTIIKPLASSPRKSSSSKMTGRPSTTLH